MQSETLLLPQLAVLESTNPSTPMTYIARHALPIVSVMNQLQMSAPVMLLLPDLPMSPMSLAQVSVSVNSIDRGLWKE